MADTISALASDSDSMEGDDSHSEEEQMCNIPLENISKPSKKTYSLAMPVKKRKKTKTAMKVCHVCKKRFSKKNLEVHVLSHYGYPCAQCKTVYPDMAQLESLVKHNKHVCPLDKMSA